ncbi:MBL fold metallo-hydrolase [Candidatus Villigracilis affinis]|uniref:MBL fold metallo-hydrolase n=1 Tax=Candidatus Villigracilis affinis TaxID=3140682 RepID=UPI002A1A0DB4|nr:MBL fold metallo-hydrolase [Anaerolineales bacterium]
MTSKLLPQSEHFTYHELAEGVWAAIVIPTGLAASNSGIVDLGDRTLIFDTTFSPASAAELRNVAESLTGRPVDYVLNSHWHRDHVFGNAAFAPETEIYATARTSEIIAEKTEADIVEFKQHWPNQLKEWAESAKTAKDETEQLDFEDGVRFAQSIIDTFPQLELRLPDHIFTDRVEFKGTKRTVEFVTFGGGHTDSDAFLHLPIEKIIFTGDLLATKFQPGMSSGHPHEWLNILAKIKALDPIQLVSGHGELATLADVELIEQYINALLQMAKQNQHAGGTAESAAALQPPAFTDGWNNSEGFELSMKFLHELLQPK